MGDDLLRLLDDPTAYLDHPDAALRRLAAAAAPASAIERLGGLLASDPEAAVRAAAAESLGRCGASAATHLTPGTADPDPTVREAVATAYGEIGEEAALPWLTRAALHDVPLVAEAAVAALGALGAERALPVLLRLVAEGRPSVRRRCVVALTVFDDPRAEAAIRRAARDRNPAVREVAELLVGRDVTGGAPGPP